MKIALIHDYFVHIRGGERVLLLLSQLFPSADLYLLILNPQAIPLELQTRNICTSFIQNLPFSSKFFRVWLPLYPYAVEQFDLREYDVVLSCSSGFSHGVITVPKTCHISYCLSPFRYAWSWYHTFIQKQNWWRSWTARRLLHHIRLWDQQAANRVDYYAAISQVTRQRIRKFYRRDATVIHPPVDLSQFKVCDKIEDFYLIVSALVPYKRIEIAIEAFNHLKLPLKIIGEGPEARRLKVMAHSNIEFLGSLSDAQVRSFYSRCLAFIFTAEEDYGITPLEAQASGRPVIAYKAGGALETVVDGVTGIFFKQQTAESLIQAVKSLKTFDFDPQTIRKHTNKFDILAFMENMTSFVRDSLAEYRNTLGLRPIAWKDEKNDG
jgi:glycosyltransferase involved in cell wall biosynthesis